MMRTRLALQWIKSPVLPNFIPSLSRPIPQVLWIGCSDSRIAETTVLNLIPDEIIVHRNLGNILSNNDLSSASAVQYAVEILQVKHIIVCGHYDCRLISTIGDTRPIIPWLKNIEELRAAHQPELEGITENKKRDGHLAEQNVIEQVHFIERRAEVVKAMQDRGLKVHGFMYDPIEDKCTRLMEILSGV